MPVPFKGRLWEVWLLLVSLATFGFTPWLYQLALTVYHQIGFVRTLGVLAVLSGALMLLALAIALPAAVIVARLGGWARPAWRLGFYASAVGTVLALGLCVFFWSPRLAPNSVLIGGGMAWLALMTAFWRYDEATQAFITLTVSRGVALVMALPFLAAPWILQGLLSKPPRVADSPLPPTAPTVRKDAPRRIVLVSFDSLRARSTSLHTPALANTPALEALAREASWFPHCHAAGDHTVAGMAAVLTGVAPHRIFSQVESPGGHIPNGVVSGLASHLAAAGYRSYYDTSLINPSVIGLGNEFESGAHDARIYDDSEFNTRAFLPLPEVGRWLTNRVRRQDAPAAVLPRTGMFLTRLSFDRARAKLKAASDRTFMWVHLGVPHYPYFKMPAGTPDDPLRHVGQGKYVYRDGAKDPASVRRLEEAYESYVRFGDGELGRFLTGLKHDGLWDDTLLVVLSDHGEEFGTDTEGHGNGTLSEDVTHIPLLVHRPGQRRGERVDHTASQLDVAPTILSQVYAEVPAGFKGKPLLDRPVPGDRLALSVGPLGSDKLPDTLAAYQDGFKYWRDRRIGAERLFDLRRDPLGLHDIAGREPGRLAALKRDAQLVME